MRHSIGWALLAACVASAAGAQDDAVFPGRKGGQDTFGHYAVVAGLAEAARAASGSRRLDLRRGAERVRGKPGPRVRAAARRAAGGRAPRDAALARRRAEPRVPGVPAADQERDGREPARRRRRRHDAAGRAQSVAGGGRRARRRRALGALHPRVRRATATSSRTGRSGTRCSRGRTPST